MVERCDGRVISRQQGFETACHSLAINIGGLSISNSYYWWLIARAPCVVLKLVYFF